MKTKRIIGLMSGTSLDGLDIAYVLFSGERETNFELRFSKTLEIPAAYKSQLLEIDKLSGRQLYKLNRDLGYFYALSVNNFILENGINKLEIDAIASHGQTIFHQPEEGFTVQLGCGSTLAYHTGIPVINDFRSLDVAAGGQGAPLVPLGDLLLFGAEADAFLNIGGFSNISFQTPEGMKAYDIGPGNLPINKYARLLGKEMDENGSIAAAQMPDENLIQSLNQLAYYKQSSPKSLGTEWLDQSFYPLIPKDISTETIISSITKHVAIQIAQELNANQFKKVLISGGGAFNKTLLTYIQSAFQGKLMLPEPKIIQFKEAIIFAFLGFRFLEKEHNSLASVTGASLNVCGGALHYPK